MIALFLILPVVTLDAATYDFNKNSGVDNTAKESGHLTQRLFGENIGIDSGIQIILMTLLSVLGIVFLILMIYGGVMWMAASGKEERVTKAKDIITEAIVGFIVVAAAYAFTYFILGAFVNKL